MRSRITSVGTPSPGDASGDKAVSSRQIDASPPEPPHQHDDWIAPPGKVPDEFVKAARLLFEQGLADPRGCEYRAIEVRTDGGVTPTHGWVLPIRQGDEQRYAVCWNGLVYALVCCGKQADLGDDVRSAIARAENGTRPEPGWQPSNDEARAVWHKTLGTADELATALLLRRGEGGLASDLWAAKPHKRALRYFYALLARQFVETWLQRLQGAHRRGGDSVALRDARRLMAFFKVASVEAKASAPDGEWDVRRLFQNREQLSDLLADQERRARAGPRPAVVCVGPGRHPDAAQRIAALIARLDEADEYHQYRGWTNDAVVQALVREGEPALEPLLQCYAEDRRLTRAVHTLRHDRGDESTQCPNVRQAARAAIDDILERLHVEPFRSDFLPAEATPRQEAAAIRDHVKNAKRLPFAERCFNLLADDAKPERWEGAALVLTHDVENNDRPRTAVWSAAAFGVGDNGPKPLGEQLRGQANPSVTELLLRRIDQSDGRSRTGLIQLLNDWEPQAARGPLVAQMTRTRQAEDWAAYVRCVIDRYQLGDRKALDDYVNWIVTVPSFYLARLTL